MVLKSLGNAFKKMSQRALWRGDRGQSQMLESHGLAGMRNNLLRDTPTYKKDAVGLAPGKTIINTQKNDKNISDRNTNSNTKVNPTSNSNTQNKNKGLGANILDSL